MKSAMPLEISPKDRDGFMNQLKEINSSETVLKFYEFNFRLRKLMFKSL